MIQQQKTTNKTLDVHSIQIITMLQLIFQFSFIVPFMIDISFLVKNLAYISSIYIYIIFLLFLSVKHFAQ